MEFLSLPATNRIVKLVIVIPAFNESSVLESVLKSLPKSIGNVNSIQTIVVDDGSSDDTLALAKEAGVLITKHVINRGAGAATKTGIELAKSLSADIIVTFDADGQPDPRDIGRLISPVIEGKADLVIGSRLKKRQKMPIDRFILNWLGNFVTFILCGAFSTDTQSGLRAFSNHAASKIDFKSDRMEFSAEISQDAKRHHRRICEIPTSAIYTAYSRSKGQKNTNALPILIRTLVKFLR